MQVCNDLGEYMFILSFSVLCAQLLSLCVLVKESKQTCSVCSRLRHAHQSMLMHSSIYHRWHLAVLLLSSSHLKRTHFSHQKSRCDFCVRGVVILPFTNGISVRIFPGLRSLRSPPSPLPPSVLLSLSFSTWMLSEALRAPVMPCLLKIPPFFPAASCELVYI